MVIDEKGLLRAMKEAYKTTGYKVAADNSTGVDMLVIGTPLWVAEIEQDNVPRKVLGLIAEHIGTLPMPGQAWQVHKKETQTEIHNVSVGLLEDLKKATASGKIKRTSLNWNGYQLWQCPKTLEVFMVPPGNEDILDNYKREVWLVGGMLYISGVASKLYISPSKVSQSESAALTHLAGMQWVE